MVSPTEVTVIIQVYYSLRRRNLKQCLKAIASGSFVPKHVLIWNNSKIQNDAIELEAYFPGTPWSVDPWDIRFVHSGHNTLMGRYAAILITETPYVFVQDDDLLVGKNTVGALIEGAEMLRTNMASGIAGVQGRELAPKSPRPYSDGIGVYSGDAQIVLGRCWAAHRGAIIPGVALCLHENIYPGRSDDIVMSMANGSGAIMIADGEAAIKNLDERGVGLSHESRHMEERDEMAAKVLKMIGGIDEEQGEPIDLEDSSGHAN